MSGELLSTNTWIITYANLAYSVQFIKISNKEKALAVGMAEKAAEFKATGSEIYHGNLPDGAKEHH